MENTKKFNVAIFKERLRDCRKEKGISQEKFAEEVGIARANASYYENDANRALPNAKVLYNMAQILGVSCNYLCGEDDCTEPSFENAKIFTGLSQSAMLRLNQLAVIGMADIVSALIDDKDFLIAVHNIRELFDLPIDSDKYYSIVEPSEFKEIKGGGKGFALQAPGNIIDGIYRTAAKEALTRVAENVINKNLKEAREQVLAKLKRGDAENGNSKTTDE